MALSTTYVQYHLTNLKPNLSLNVVRTLHINTWLGQRNKWKAAMLGEYNCCSLLNDLLNTCKVLEVRYFKDNELS